MKMFIELFSILSIHFFVDGSTVEVSRNYASGDIYRGIHTCGDRSNNIGAGVCQCNETFPVFIGYTETILCQDMKGIVKSMGCHTAFVYQSQDIVLPCHPLRGTRHMTVHVRNTKENTNMPFFWDYNYTLTRNIINNNIFVQGDKLTLHDLDGLLLRIGFQSCPQHCFIIKTLGSRTYPYTVPPPTTTTTTTTTTTNATATITNTTNTTRQEIITNSSNSIGFSPLIIGIIAASTVIILLLIFICYKRRNQTEKSIEKEGDEKNHQAITQNIFTNDHEPINETRFCEKKSQPAVSTYEVIDKRLFNGQKNQNNMDPSNFQNRTEKRIEKEGDEKNPQAITQNIFTNDHEPINETRFCEKKSQPAGSTYEVTDETMFNIQKNQNNMDPSNYQNLNHVEIEQSREYTSLTNDAMSRKDENAQQTKPNQRINVNYEVSYWK